MSLKFESLAKHLFPVPLSLSKIPCVICFYLNLEAIVASDPIEEYISKVLCIIRETIIGMSERG